MKAHLKMPDKKTRVLQIKSDINATMTEFWQIHEKIMSVPLDARVQEHAPLWRKWANLAVKAANLVDRAAEIDRNEGERI